jgi:hypothetical protein
MGGIHGNQRNNNNSSVAFLQVVEGAQSEHELVRRAQWCPCCLLRHLQTPEWFSPWPGASESIQALINCRRDGGKQIGKRKWFKSAWSLKFDLELNLANYLPKTFSEQILKIIFQPAGLWTLLQFPSSILGPCYKNGSKRVDQSNWVNQDLLGGDVEISLSLVTL